MNSVAMGNKIYPTIPISILAKCQTHPSKAFNRYMSLSLIVVATFYFVLFSSCSFAISLPARVPNRILAKSPQTNGGVNRVELGMDKTIYPIGNFQMLIHKHQLKTFSRYSTLSCLLCNFALLLVLNCFCVCCSFIITSHAPDRISTRTINRKTNTILMVKVQHLFLSFPGRYRMHHLKTSEM